ncbi:MAG: hypothetical protein NTV51_14590 [Verrucomicrobia bacterium]|nr:hypothetical protein [Verrucomicrobiota bacterium]
MSLLTEEIVATTGGLKSGLHLRNTAQNFGQRFRHRLETPGASAGTCNVAIE